MKLVSTLEGLQELQDALSDVIAYLADNSCGDPDCCDGPYYTKEEYERGLGILFKFGIEYDEGFDRM